MILLFPSPFPPEDLVPWTLFAEAEGSHRFLRCQSVQHARVLSPLIERDTPAPAGCPGGTPFLRPQEELAPCFAGPSSHIFPLRAAPVGPTFEHGFPTVLFSRPSFPLVVIRTPPHSAAPFQRFFFSPQSPATLLEPILPGSGTPFFPPASQDGPHSVQ